MTAYPKGELESLISKTYTDSQFKVASDLISSKVSQTDYTGNSIASLINQTATTVAIQASKINLIGAVTIGALDSSVTAAALGGATPSDVSTAVDNIQIGGRNFYLRNTNWSYYGGWGNYGITTDADGYIHIHVSDGWALYSVLSRITSSQVTVSYDIKVSNATGQGTYLFFTLQNTPAWSGSDMTVLTTEWTHHSFTASADTYLSIIAGVSPEGKGYSADITIRNLMVEEGNKESSWTPAPEDVAQDVTNKVNALSAAHGGFTFLDSNSVYTGTLTAGQVNAVGINANSITTGTLNADRIAGNSITGDKIVANSITGDKIVGNTITGDKIVANSITSTQINATSVSAAIASVISLDAARITTGTINSDRIDVVSVVAKGLVAQTIDAQSATISNLNVVNATVNGYFQAEYSGEAFVRIGMPESPKMLAIRADGLTGIDIGVFNSTGLSITANGLNSSTALNIHGNNYLITRIFSVAEGTWINGLSLCRVTITSGGDLGFGSLGWYQNYGYYMPNFIVSKASSDI